MNIKLFNSLKIPGWDKFVNESNNGTIFHKLKFLQYHPKTRYKFYNLVFLENNQIISLLPGELKDNIFRSPVGATYGSFITKNISFSKYEEIINEFIMYARKNKFNKIYITPPPIIYLKEINQTENFLFQYKNFKIEKSLITSALNLEAIKNKNDLLLYLKKRFARNIKTSYKHKIIISFSSDYKAFYPILLDNQKRYNLTPTHSLKEMIKLSKTFPNDVKLLIAYDKNKIPIAGLFLIAANSTTLITFYISHYYHEQNKRAINRLLYEATIWAKTNHFRWLDLGVSMEVGSLKPMEPRRSLIYFKEGLNTNGFLRTTYYLKL